MRVGLSAVMVASLALVSGSAVLGQDPQCYSTIALGRCCNETQQTVFCNNGEGPACTIRNVTCGQFKLAVSTTYGKQDVAIFFCEIRDERKECRAPQDPPGLPESCEDAGVTITRLVGSEAVGAGCGPPFPYPE